MVNSLENCRAAITCEAYAKINLHAAKYSSELMCGFLVGSVSTQDDKGNIGSTVTVDDVLPISHSNPVGPIFEVAGGMCSELYPGKDVVGLYYTSDCGEYGNHDTTPHFADKVCDTIKVNNQHGLCVILTVAAGRINPTTADDDVDVGDDIASILCLNAYVTNTNTTSGSSGGSSSSSKKSGGNRERTASFHSLKVPLSAVGGTSQSHNAVLDKLLLGSKQLTIEDVQSHMSGRPGEISVKNAHINVEVGLLNQ